MKKMQAGGASTKGAKLKEKGKFLKEQGSLMKASGKAQANAFRNQIVDTKATYGNKVGDRIQSTVVATRRNGNKLIKTSSQDANSFETKNQKIAYKEIKPVKKENKNISYSKTPKGTTIKYPNGDVTFENKKTGSVTSKTKLDKNKALVVHANKNKAYSKVIKKK